MAKKHSTKLEGVSSQAVMQATGHDWDERQSILDDAGAADWDHKQIVAFLKENHDVSSWWRQTVTVAYEKAKGRRVVGQTADTVERLPSPESRDEMKAHWRSVLEELAKLAGKNR